MGGNGVGEAAGVGETAGVAVGLGANQLHASEAITTTARAVHIFE
jgi:hypothetical protein